MPETDEFYDIPQKPKKGKGPHSPENIKSHSIIHVELRCNGLLNRFNSARLWCLVVWSKTRVDGALMVFFRPD